MAMQPGILDPQLRAGDETVGPSRTQVITVTSGKGGWENQCGGQHRNRVGTNRQKVLVLDADLGLGNVDILLGLTPKYTLEHVLAKTCRLEDIALTGPMALPCCPRARGSRN